MNTRGKLAALALAMAVAGNNTLGAYDYPTHSHSTWNEGNTAEGDAIRKQKAEEKRLRRQQKRLNNKTL